jgi:hypothetical protein
MKNLLPSLLVGGVFALASASAGCASTTPPPATATSAAIATAADPTSTSTSLGVANSQPPPTDDFVFVEKDARRSAATDDSPATDLHPTDMAGRPKNR